jgi:hypothetical protein
VTWLTDWEAQAASGLRCSIEGGQLEFTFGICPARRVARARAPFGIGPARRVARRARPGRGGNSVTICYWDHSNKDNNIVQL